MQQRQSGLDLIRVTGFFLVTLFHAFLYNGYYGQPQVGFAMWSAGGGPVLEHGLQRAIYDPDRLSAL